MKLDDKIAKNLYLRVSTIPNAGIGVFTKSKIGQGVPVCEYKGDVLDSTQVKSRSSEYVINHAILGLKIDGNPAVAEDLIGFGGFINDKSINPDYYVRDDEINISFDFTKKKFITQSEEQLKNGYNVHFFPDPNKEVVMLISLREIQAGEELFADYGRNYWKKNL